MLKCVGKCQVNQYHRTPCSSQPMSSLSRSQERKGTQSGQWLLKVRQESRMPKLPKHIRYTTRLRQLLHQRTASTNSRLSSIDDPQHCVSALRSLSLPPAKSSDGPAPARFRMVGDGEKGHPFSILDSLLRVFAG